VHLVVAAVPVAAFVTPPLDAILNNFNLPPPSAFGDDLLLAGLSDALLRSHHAGGFHTSAAFETQVQ
jgi:hypothetical protein